MSRKKRGSRSSTARRRPTQRRFSELRRFFKLVGATAVVTFGVASGLLNPQWREHIDISPWLGEWALPGGESVAPLAQAAGEYAQTNFAQCRDFFPASGTPVVPVAPRLRELCFSSFAILHSGNTKTPVFVAQRLSRAMLAQARNVERNDRFYAEARLPSAERAELADYRGSGYSRGHMAPAADMHTPEAMAQSFSLANMVPQNQVQNAGAWSRIEQDTRKYIMRAQGPVYVFTGPVYEAKPARIGEGGVAVPDHLYKVVHDASTGHTWVHWQPNHEGARAGKPIAYEQFVRRTGLHLLGTAG